jgi:calmodulin
MDGLKQGVSHELMKEAKVAFALFDKQSGGTIKTRDMGLILRSLGFALSGSDIKKMEKDADKDGMGLVKLPDFLRQLDAALALTRASKEETKKAIKLMDDGLARLVENKRSGSGSISSHYFRQALTRMGERMSQDEFVEMCRELEVVDGRITVDALTKYVVI